MDSLCENITVVVRLRPLSEIDAVTRVVPAVVPTPESNAVTATAPNPHVRQIWLQCECSR